MRYYASGLINASLGSGEPVGLKHMMFTQETVVQRCSVKKVFLEISQSPQENTCTRVSFLIKLQASDLRILRNF